MENAKYSVIIPVYNAEKTIIRCLNSILAFQRDDLEILVVNDGSTDQTERLCLLYAEQHKQVRYFAKANGGVSSARNLGIDKSTGKYIIFVDSDDYLCGDIFSLADREMPAGRGMLMSTTTEEKRHTPAVHIEGREEVAETLFKLLKNQQLNTPCSKVFCGEIIRNEAIRFDERLDIGEDKVFVVQYSVFLTAVTMCTEVCYGISRENAESLSRKKRKNLSESILLEHDLLFSAVENAPLSEKSKKHYKRAVSYSFHRSAYTVIAELRKFDYSRKERIAKAKEILNEYSKRKDPLYYNAVHFFFAIPVRLKLAGIVDGLVGAMKRPEVPR